MQIVSYNYDCIWGEPNFDVPKLHIFEIVLLIKKMIKGHFIKSYQRD